MIRERRRNVAPKSKQQRKLQPAEIEQLRERFVADIATARQFQEVPSAILVKAQALLTTHWGRSTWAGRADILRTVDWLLRVGIGRPASVASPRRV